MRTLEKTEGIPDRRGARQREVEHRRVLVDERPGRESSLIEGGRRSSYCCCSRRVGLRLEGHRTEREEEGLGSRGEEEGRNGQSCRGRRSAGRGRAEKKEEDRESRRGSRRGNDRREESCREEGQSRSGRHGEEGREGSRAQDGRLEVHWGV